MRNDISSGFRKGKTILIFLHVLSDFFLPYAVQKDETKGSSGWERFEFNKDAPLDEEEVQG